MSRATNALSTPTAPPHFHHRAYQAVEEVAGQVNRDVILSFRTDAETGGCEAGTSGRVRFSAMWTWKLASVETIRFGRSAPL
jgi:hypothetical protein